ncbi:hypothetical protein [Paenibacillus planticolens]|nr:hypothetical protein [Paenibacillus planticolens]
MNTSLGKSGLVDTYYMQGARRMSRLERVITFFLPNYTNSPN